MLPQPSNRRRQLERIYFRTVKQIYTKSRFHALKPGFFVPLPKIMAASDGGTSCFFEHVSPCVFISFFVFFLQKDKKSLQEKYFFIIFVAVETNLITYDMKHILPYLASLIAVFSFFLKGFEARGQGNFQYNDMVLFTITGKVYAVDTFHVKPYPLAGAAVKVMLPTNKEYKTYGNASNKDGLFSVNIYADNSIKSYNAKLQVSYVGMEPWEKTVKMKLKSSDGIPVYTAYVDSVVLKSKSVTLEEVQIMGELRKVYMRGDTTVFNVGAYKMPEGSMLLELVRRLPGLHYTDGRLTYKGRSIAEMRLNGDTFFKNDITIALKNMPNSVLKSVEVYEAKTDTTNPNSKKKLVMDMKTTKKVSKMNLGNIDAALADNLDDYALSGSMSYYKTKGAQASVSGELKNLPDIGNVLYSNQNFKNFAAYVKNPIKRGSVTSQYEHKYNSRLSKETDKSWKMFDNATQKTVGDEAEFWHSRQNEGSFTFDKRTKKRMSINFSLRISDTQRADYSLENNTETLDDVDINRSSVNSNNWYRYTLGHFSFYLI